MTAAAKTLKKTSSDVKDRIVGPSAKRAADAVAETLADHYPVVRNAFLTAAAEPFDAIVDDDAGLAQQRLFDEYPSLTIDPLNDGGMLPLSMLPPDGDYLGRAAPGSRAVLLSRRRSRDAQRAPPPPPTQQYGPGPGGGAPEVIAVRREHR